MTKFSTCKVCSGSLHPENERLELSTCTSCGLVFCTRIFSQQEFIEVYDRLYNSDNAIYSNHSVAEYAMLQSAEQIKIGRKRAALIKKNIVDAGKKSVLEIGSGIGLIGKYLQQNAPEIKYKGIEIDEQSFLKSRNFGLDALNGDFTLMESLPESVDSIMLWEVLEHLQDLKGFLDLAFKKLNSGGNISLSTPNYAKIYNYPNRSKDVIFQDEPPVHINFFTKENLKNIFEIAGFASVDISVKPFPYFNPKLGKFYTDVFRALIGNYNGSTLYLTATKM